MYRTGSNQFSKIELQIILRLTAADNLLPFSKRGKYIKGQSKLGIPVSWANTVSETLFEFIVCYCHISMSREHVVGIEPFILWVKASAYKQQ